MTVRLSLFCHAATAATRSAAFPADEAIDASEAAKTAALAASLRRVDAAWTSPALRARQTAAALGLDAGTETALGELDYGRWSARSLAEIQSSEPANLAAWIADPGAAPHGGESIDGLLGRTARWLDAMLRERGRIVAVTHASVVRAAVLVVLGAGPAAFWRIDVAPLCRLSLQGRRGSWTLRALGVEDAASRTGIEP